MSLVEMPDHGRFSGGAAYRNRTDDLRITRGTLSCLTCTSCTDINGAPH